MYFFIHYSWSLIKFNYSLFHFFHWGITVGNWQLAKLFSQLKTYLCQEVSENCKCIRRHSHLQWKFSK